MLIIDEKLLQLDEELDGLVAAILEEPVIASYLAAKATFLADEELQRQLSLLEENQNYLPFRKELQELQKSLLLNEKVYALRVAENDVQELLSKLAAELTGAISPEIWIDENLPLKKGGRHGRHHK